MSSSIELFHCNDEAKINKFIEDDKYLIISQHTADDVWAGKGMYFWDNKGNAKYWYRDRIRKYPNSAFLIAQANIEYDQDTIMDLSDFETEQTCFKFISELEKKGIISHKDSLGKKIDFICPILGLKVVRIMGHYSNTPQTGFLKRSKVSNKNKVIYCIKKDNFDIIKQRKVIGD